MKKIVGFLLMASLILSTHHSHASFLGSLVEAVGCAAANIDC